MPKFLKEIIDSFRIEDVLSWLKEVMIFYVLPKRFFKVFFSKPYLKQVYQIFFYTLISILINILLFKKYAYSDYSTTLAVLFITISFLICNSISLLIISKSKFNLWKVFSIVYIVWLLFSYPSLVFVYVFNVTENFTFYFLSNCLNALSMILSLFIIWHVLFDKVIKIILACFLNIIVLNILNIAASYLTIDTRSNAHSIDPILNEFLYVQEMIEPIDDKIPYKVVTFSNEENKFFKYALSFKQNDSTIYYNDDDVKFFLEKNDKKIVLIDSLISLVHYARNKEIFLDISTYYKNVKKSIISKPPDSLIMKDSLIKISERDSIYLHIKEFIFDPQYAKSLVSFYRKRDELFELDDFATYPFYVMGYVFEPTYLVASLFNVTVEDGETVNFVIPL